ncbi:MAG: hypothetical protein HKM07_03865, partial [Chlamydiae bacterium]|nr:hypothetical protein [Chlamydiota bacterium]
VSGVAEHLINKKDFELESFVLAKKIPEKFKELVRFWICQHYYEKRDAAVEDCCNDREWDSTTTFYNALLEDKLDECCDFFAKLA